MLKSSRAFMHRNSWGVIWSHPNSWDSCLMRTHWLYIRDLCMRYLSNRQKYRWKGETRGHIQPAFKECSLEAHSPAILQEKLAYLSCEDFSDKGLSCSPRPPNFWYPDKGSSSLVRMWFSTWNFQACISFLFPESGTGKHDQMNTMGQGHGLPDYSVRISTTGRARTCPLQDFSEGLPGNLLLV